MVGILSLSIREKFLSNFFSIKLGNNNIQNNSSVIPSIFSCEGDQTFNLSIS